MTIHIIISVPVNVLYDNDNYVCDTFYFTVHFRK